MTTPPGLTGAGQDVACTNVTISSSGIWMRDNPLNFTLPRLMLQMTIIFVITRAIRVLVKPLGQPTIVPDILGGILVGLNKTFAAKVFPKEGRIVLDTITMVGASLVAFISGVKVDASMVTKSKKGLFTIAVSSIITPLVIVLIVTSSTWKYIPNNLKQSSMLSVLTGMTAITTFPVVSSAMFDLQILSSELGRLGISTALLCDMVSFPLTVIGTSLHLHLTGRMFLFSLLSVSTFVLLVVTIVPLASGWMISRTQEAHVPDIYIFVIVIGVIMSCFFSEFIGQPTFFGAFIYGLAIPDGPPLGAALVDRLETFVTGVIFPLFFAYFGTNMDVFAIKDWKIAAYIMFMFIVGCFGKVIGTLLSSLYCNIPFRDALVLGFILSSRGMIDIFILDIWRQFKIANEETFSIGILCVFLITSTTSPIIKILYSPSMQYFTFKKRTIQNSNPEGELRILVCVHHEDHVPAMISLLQASHTNKQSPLSIFVLHLVQLVGRDLPMLIDHGEDQVPSNIAFSEHILNAFKRYEEQSKACVTVHAFTSVAPTVSMHDDIGFLAFRMRVSLILLPYHKQQEVDNTMGSTDRVVQVANRHVLQLAPCSVAILVDRGFLTRKKSTLINQVSHNVAVIFFGGSDDREALMLSMRISDTQKVRLTLVRFVGAKDDGQSWERGKRLDDEMVNTFRARASGKEMVGYREVPVENGEDTVDVIRSLCDICDLFIVGRGEGIETPATSGLASWYDGQKELGIIGDILSSSDFGGNVSVLVVQQQVNERPGTLRRNSSIFVQPLEGVEEGFVQDKYKHSFKTQKLDSPRKSSKLSRVN